MSALIIANYDVDDQAALDEYRKLAGPILRETYGAVGVVNTDRTLDLGEGAGAGSNTVIFRFESAEVARAAWESDEYQAVIGQRFAATTPRFAVLVETL